MQPHEVTGSRVRVATRPWGTQITLCRPERRNALDRQAVVELLAAFAADGPGAVLLSAEGPAFCAGGDLRMLRESAEHGDLAGMLLTNAGAFADVIEAIIASPRPVVAAIDGPAVGGGASLALACDVRLATPRARLVLAWGRHGLPPDGCVTATLAAAVGPARARSLLADGADLGVEADVAPQLFSRVVEAARLEQEALATVTALAGSAEARAAKAATRDVLLPAVRRHRQAELAAIARAAADPAVVTGLAMLYKIDR